MDGTATATCNFSDLPGFKWNLTSNHVVNCYSFATLQDAAPLLGGVAVKLLSSEEFRGRC